jgi:hypothetical protein
MRAGVSASPHCVEPVVPSPVRARRPSRRVRGWIERPGVRSILRDERRAIRRKARIRSRSVPSPGRSRAAVPGVPSAPKRFRFPRLPFELCRSIAPVLPFWFAVEALGPRRFAIWRFREAPCGVSGSTGLLHEAAHLRYARGKPVASAWRRLRQPPSPFRFSVPPAKEDRFGSGLRPSRSGSRRSLSGSATGSSCHLK